MKKKYIFLMLLICSLFICLPISRVLAAGVEINTASLEELDQITSVGPVIAQRIVDARPFSSIDDLARVKGIGDKTLQKIKDQGLAYVGGGRQTTQTNQTQTAQAQNTNPVTQVPPPTPVAPPPSPAATYPDGVSINEILPSPEGPDETDEWIELHNTNNADVSLENWKIKDTQGTTTTYTFPQNTVIESNGYMVLKRPQTKIILNNQEDGLNLLQPNGKIVDSVNYSSAPKNQSYSKIDDDWQWSGALTPGAANSTSAEATSSAKSNAAISVAKTSPVLSKTEKTDNKYLSAISESISPTSSQVVDDTKKEHTSNPWLLFFGTLAVILILGTAILILKFKVFKKPTI